MRIPAAPKEGGDAMPVRIDHSRRKARIRRAIIARQTNHEIAAALGVDPRTVERYIHRYGLSGLRQRRVGRPAPPRPAAASVRTRGCLGCGRRIPSAAGRWLCDACRHRRVHGSLGVPDHWLQTPGHA
jgi:hypothetical protein